MFLAVDLMARDRKSRSFKLDEIVIDALLELARSKNMSVNRLVELMLMDDLKAEGLIDPSTVPLGETRGLSAKDLKED